MMPAANNAYNSWRGLEFIYILVFKQRSVTGNSKKNPSAKVVNF